MKHLTDILFIKATKVSEQPILDEYTSMVEYIFEMCTKMVWTAKTYTCAVSGKTSNAISYHPKLHIRCNSLSVFYIKYCRGDVSEFELSAIQNAYRAIKNQKQYYDSLAKLIKKSEPTYFLVGFFGKNEVSEMYAIKWTASNEHFLAYINNYMLIPCNEQTYNSIKAAPKTKRLYQAKKIFLT